MSTTHDPQAAETFSRYAPPGPTKTEKVLKVLSLIGLVAGTIAAGAQAAHAHFTKAGK